MPPADINIFLFFKGLFSNNSEEAVENLNFINSALDKPETGANNIAYVDGTTAPMFSNATYMWIRKNGEISKPKISTTQLSFRIGNQLSINNEPGVVSRSAQKESTIHYLNEGSAVNYLSPRGKNNADTIKKNRGLRDTITVRTIKIKDINL